MPKSGVGRMAVWVGCAGLVGLVAIQLIRPPIGNPPVTADLQAPPEVKQILRTSCYDCHSNETRLSWFDQIAPGYWLVARDVKQGRAHLNFSEIGKLPPAQQQGVLYEAVNQMRLGAMPLAAYTRLHGGTAVTPEKIETLEHYLYPGQPASAPPETAADEAQYQRWIEGGQTARTVAPAPNGIAFLPDYKNWKAVSATDRFDNGSLRAVLGNETAVQAIAANRTNPWPDGTAFAKVAWLARDGGGKVKAGPFFQVEFMIKDHQKYAATEGWGWARWRGAELTPYGKNADFVNECTGCHAPLREHDYVYTEPVRENPAAGKILGAFADGGTSTISLLVGNDAAVQYARSHADRDYPAGSVLTLVTWKEREDGHWFGARIPGALQSVQSAQVPVGADGGAAALLSLRPVVLP